MKKRIFTLLAFGMLIGGISSTLSAQTLNSAKIKKETYLGGTLSVYESKIAGNPMPRITNSELSVTTMYVEIYFPTSFAKKEATVYFDYNSTAEYLGLPASYTFKDLDTIALPATKIIPITVNKDWNMPNSVNGSKGIIRASFDKTFQTYVGDTTTYYNYPTFTVDYRSTTTKYEGSLRISSITGGNPDYNKYMDRVLLKDSVYSYFTDTIVLYPFSEIEVANLTYGDKILVETAWENYVVDIPRLEDEESPNTISRPVTVPVVSDAILNYGPGVYYTPSTYDFTFTIKPTASNAGKTPVVTTGRTDIPDSEGVTYKQLPDGSWIVTIARVQTPINLSISFTVGNATIESNSVWANGGQLYINTATSSKASIYSITGALVKTIAISAGETANTSLSRGLYVVTVNGKAYKVTVK